MGFPPSLFTDNPNEEMTCAICREIQDIPTSCNCGHTFCKTCLEEWVESDDSSSARCTTCPTCREEFDYGDEYHNKALHRMVHNMRVKCPNNNSDNNGRACFKPRENPRNGEEERACQRRKLDENGDFEDIHKSSKGGCTWTGCLIDYNEKHKEECPLEKVTCIVPGCSFQCLRKDLDNHLDNGSGRLEHMRLILEEETNKMKEFIIADLEVAFQSEKEEVIREYKEIIDEMQMLNHEQKERIIAIKRLAAGLSFVGSILAIFGTGNYFFSFP